MDKTTFEYKVNKTSDCWLWTGYCDPKGYGQAYYYGEKWRAHRLSYTIYIGPIPKGLHVLHMCDVRNCVNPDHLFLGTNQDNVWDKLKKGRHNNGNKDITHCTRGHEFTPENTYYYGGKRICRVCSILRRHIRRLHYD